MQDIYQLIYEYIPEYHIYHSTENWIEAGSALSVVMNRNIDLNDSKYRRGYVYAHTNQNYLYYNCIIKSINDPYNIELIILNRRMDGRDSPGILNVNIADIYIFPDIRDDYNYNYCKWLIKTKKIYYINQTNIYNILEHIISDENLMKKIQHNFKKFSNYIQKSILWYIYIYNKSLLKKYNFDIDDINFQFEKFNSSIIFHITRERSMKTGLIKEIQKEVLTRSWYKKDDLWHEIF